MINVLLALAGLALTVPAPARAAEVARPSKSQPSKSQPAKSRPTKSKPSQPRNADAAFEVTQSAAATRVADWIAASGDNGALPYIIVDKPNASLFLFDAKRKSLGEAPVLIGVAVGDDASPGIGRKSLAKIGIACDLLSIFVNFWQ